MADEVDATLEDEDVVELDHERDDGEGTMGSAMSARDDGEVGVVVDIGFFREETTYRLQCQLTTTRTLDSESTGPETRRPNIMPAQTSTGKTAA